MIIDFTAAKTERENKKEETQRQTVYGGVIANTGIRIVDSGYTNEAENRKSHAAEPIKNAEDIQKVVDYLLTAGRYRDNLLFVAGINFGFRVSDLRRLKVGHFIDETGAFKEKVELDEKKTRKHRVVWINEAVAEAAKLYFDELLAKEGELDLNRFLFTSEDHRCRNLRQPLDTKSIERILKSIVNDQCGIKVHASTHMLRKTFSYHMIMGAKDRTRAIEMLQKLMNHSSPTITLMYAGITDDEMRDSYMSLNLGKIYTVSKVEEAV